MPNRPATAQESRRIRCQTAFISDLHLGTAGCRAERLLDFLRQLDTQRLYLVGDVIDLERMQQVVHWPSAHSAVLRECLAMAARGVEVIYIPGNHDASLRALAGSTFHGIKLRLNHVHHTLDGRRLLVTHGDQFDTHLRIGTLKEKLGSAAYQWLVGLDVSINRVRARLGYDDVSLASAMKMRIKSAQIYIARYEALALNEARRRGLDGIVCGHIHKPAIIEDDGVSYYNDGDWVEHCSAIVEDQTGALSRITWPDCLADDADEKQVA